MTKTTKNDKNANAQNKAAETRAAADPKLKIPPRPADGEVAAPNGGGQPRFRGPRPNGGAMRRPGGGEGQGGSPRGPRPEGQGGAQPQRQ